MDDGWRSEPLRVLCILAAALGLRFGVILKSLEIVAGRAVEGFRGAFGLPFLRNSNRLAVKPVLSLEPRRAAASLNYRAGLFGIETGSNSAKTVLKK